MKLYTKGGDKGTTSLAGGERVEKYDKRVEAYGTIDELMSFMALLGDKLNADSDLAHYTADINRINCSLMTIGGLLAAGRDFKRDVPQSLGENITYLEGRIDGFTAELPKRFQFTIPGGLEVASLCHVCRTITRRAERRAVEAAAATEVDDQVLVYINRLSDYLYALSRIITLKKGVEAILWHD